jgi:hypothetical protein
MRRPGMASRPLMERLAVRPWRPTLGSLRRRGGAKVGAAVALAPWIDLRRWVGGSGGWLAAAPAALHRPVAWTLDPAIATASSHLLTRIVAGSWVGSAAVAVQSSRHLPHLHQDAEGHQEDTVEPGQAACFPQPRSVQSSSARRQLVVLRHS